MGVGPQGFTPFFVLHPRSSYSCLILSHSLSLTLRRTSSLSHRLILRLRVMNSSGKRKGNAKREAMAAVSPYIVSSRSTESSTWAEGMQPAAGARSATSCLGCAALPSAAGCAARPLRTDAVFCLFYYTPRLRQRLLPCLS